MATTPIQFKAPTGLSLKLELYPFGSDTIANGAGGDTAAEKTNADGLYSADVTQNITGLHDAVIVDGSDNLIATYSVNIRADDATIYRCSDDVAGLVALPDAQINNFDPASDAVGTVTILTGHTAQTGDSFARIGAAGVSLTDLGGMSTTMKAQVNTEVDGALDTAIAELASEPGATPTLRTGLMLLYMWLRNNTQDTATARKILNDAGTTIATGTMADDGTTFAQGKLS